MTDISVEELREWKRNNPEKSLYSKQFDRLIVAYRDMAIKAGEWKCECEHKAEAHPYGMVVGVGPHPRGRCYTLRHADREHGYRYEGECGCTKYRPVEL